MRTNRQILDRERERERLRDIKIEPNSKGGRKSERKRFKKKRVRENE